MARRDSKWVTPINQATLIQFNILLREIHFTKKKKGGGGGGGAGPSTNGHAGFSGQPGFSQSWSGDPNETFKMFFGNSNPFGAFFDSDDDQHGGGGFGGAGGFGAGAGGVGGGFPNMFRFPGAGGFGAQQQGNSQQASKVTRHIIYTNFKLP